MKRNALILAALLTGGLSPLLGADARTWTSVNGNTAEGTFLREEGGRIYFKHANGLTIAISRDRLSPDDLKYVDSLAAPKAAATRVSFQPLPPNEMQKLPNYRTLRRIFISTYAKLTDNHRSDKTLAFLKRDITELWFWGNVSTVCYPNPDGTDGMLKNITFFPLHGPYPLQESAYILHDKFMIRNDYPLTFERRANGADVSWVLLNPPEYVSNVELHAAPGNDRQIDSFIFDFPKPERMVKTH